MFYLRVGRIFTGQNMRRIFETSAGRFLKQRFSNLGLATQVHQKNLIFESDDVKHNKFKTYVAHNK